MKFQVRFSLWMLLACLCACTGSVNKFDKLRAPKVSILAIKLDDPNPLSPVFLVRLGLENLNDSEIALDGADAILALNGQKVAKGVSRSAITLPRQVRA